VWNAPNIGLTPAIRGIPSPLPALIAGQLAQGFNENLDATVLAPLRGLPGIQIVGLDVNTKLNDLFTNPARFDLTEARAPCVTPNLAPFQCKNADQYLFWDGIHPTTAAHGIIAQEAASVLAH
jgi:phospholipase/lecithinase/hemolysin